MTDTNVSQFRVIPAGSSVEPQPAQVAAKDTARTVLADGRVTEHATRHASVSTAPSGGSSVAATLSLFGTPSVELEPGVPGSRTDVLTAQRLGLIRRDVAGGWVDAAPVGAPPTGGQPADAPPSATDVADGDTSDLSASAFLPQEDQAYAAAIDPLSQDGYERALASTIASVVYSDGDLMPAAKELAAREGLDPAQAHELVSNLAGYYAQIVNRAVAPALGSDARVLAFRQELQERPQAFHEALQALVYKRDPSGFTKAAAAWHVKNPPDVSAWTGAGFQTSWDHATGDLMVQRAGGAWRRAKDLAK